MRSAHENRIAHLAFCDRYEANMNTQRLTSDELRQRVLSNTDSNGRLRDEAFDLDARTVAILSKRHQISASTIYLLGIQRLQIEIILTAP